MRFMMMVIPKGYELAAPDAVPSAEAVAKMMEYNKSLQKAGVLLGLDGLLSAVNRRAGFLHRRQSHGYRWAVRRGERGYRRLLDHSGALAGRSHRMGQAGTDVQQRDHRSAADSRNGRFPRRRAESSRRLRAASERGCWNGVSDTQKAIEAVWKIESTRLIAGIARVTRDIGIAEELAQDALVAALERWPEEGIPEKPAAWLMTAAKRRAIDSLRRGRMLEQKHGEIGRELEFQQRRLGEAMDQALDQVIDDDVLRLIFTACHPVLAVEGRVALTLRVACGLTTAEIARSFLVPEKTLGQRIFRAKKTLAEAHVPFETPRGDELRKRLESVLSVVYLIFNEGYTATSGEEWMRAALCEDALRLGRMLAAASSRGIGGPRSPGADGVAGVAYRGAARTNRRSRSLAGAGPFFVGPCTDRARKGCAPARAAVWVAAPTATPCRRRLQPVTREPTPQRRPTGSESCFSMTPCFRSALLRSWR